MASVDRTMYASSVILADTDSHGTIADDCASLPGTQVPESRKCEAGFERLLQKKPTTDLSDIAHCRVSKPPTYLGFSILVAAFCNCPVGAVAVIFSCLSRRSFTRGRLDKAQVQGNIAKWLNLIGIAITTVVVAFLIVYFVYINGNIVDTVSELRETMGMLSKPSNSTGGSD